jgi:hypothetical protein
MGDSVRAGTKKQLKLVIITRDQTEFIIYDLIADDYHTGNAQWSKDRANALRYPMHASAEQILDDVDTENIDLRVCLFIK